MVEHKGLYSRGYLPHLDVPGRPQFITYRLNDSLPAHVVEKAMARSGDDDGLRARQQQILDAGYGACWLQREDCARIVIENLKYHDNKRYRLIDWVIMPNHVHNVYDRPRDTLTRITHGWKSYTANQINGILNRRGTTLWQSECFDRYIRDDEHLFNVRCYIYLNPVRAGLVDDPFDWPYSSIHDRPQIRESLRRWYRQWKDRFWDVHADQDL
jgi:putative transposase